MLFRHHLILRRIIPAEYTPPLTRLIKHPGQTLQRMHMVKYMVLLRVNKFSCLKFLHFIFVGAVPFEIVCRSPIEPIFSRFYAINGISSPFDGVVPEAHGAGLERDYFFVVANDVLVGV